MSQAISETQADFTGIVGDERASADPAVCAAFAVDGVTPGWVLRPATVEQVAEMLKCATARGLAIIPCGNGTKLGIGAPPQRYDAALCLRDLNRVTYYEPDDLVASVEPGMTFGSLQRMLSEHGLWLPLDPAGGEQATVGGILAANSAGTLRLRYGSPRDIVLGMKIATTDGKIIKAGGRVVKNVSGYDLAKLLIGSYGTLGVIVEATFKLYPRVARRTTWMIGVESLAEARAFRQRLLASHLRPLRAILLNAEAAARIESNEARPAGGAKAALWIEAGGSEHVLSRYQDELGALATTVGASMAPLGNSAASSLWDRVADFGNWLTRESHSALVARAALPIAAAEDFLERSEAEAELDGWHLAGAAQLGVGVVEIGFSRAPNPASGTSSSALIDKLRHAAGNLGGSLVVTHCPADLKAAIDIWGPVGDDFEVMRKLKAAWDPQSILGPGRFLGGL